MAIEWNMLALSAAEAAGRLGQIFYFVVLPILLLAGIGFAMQRTLGLDMPTLTRLNFYFVIPAMVYFSVVTSTLAGEQVAAVVGYGVLMLAGMGGVTVLAALVRRVPRDQLSAMLMTTVFNNSGNYGLPLQDLAFRPMGLGARAMGMQVFVMVVQNLAGFTLGIFLAASGGQRKQHWRANLLHIAKFPPIYALAAALLTVGARSWMGGPAVAAAGRRLLPLWQVVVYAKEAFLAVAICTLGAQLALVARGPEARKYPVTLSVVLRLLVGPAVALGIIYVMGLNGLIAQVLLISSSTPTAVNCMLMCLAFDNHPDYAARAVFYSTLLSPITVTAVIFLAQGGLLPGFAMEPPAAKGGMVTPGADAYRDRDDHVYGPPSATTGSGEKRNGESMQTMKRNTTVGIRGREFLINGRPTYEGRTWKDMKIEGLLMNARLVQGAFDDLDPDTRGMWAYPDGPWDPDRNTREFVAAMDAWRAHGLLSFTINFQGGSPQGYSKSQPWHNSAFEADGSLRPAYLGRMEKILDRADELGMAPVVGYFYFGQDHRLADEPAVLRAADNATDWLIAQGYANVLVEIANEVNVGRYDHAIIRTARCGELIERVQKRSAGKVGSPAGRLLVGTSMGGGAIPSETIVRASDFVLLHGNGVGEPDRIRKMVDTVRAMKAYRDQPILFNEDDHFDFDKPDSNMVAAVSRYAGWGYFDYRMAGEGFDEGYQSVPVNWGISSARKKGFFGLLAEMTDASR